MDLLRQGTIILEDFKVENQETLWNRMCASEPGGLRSLRPQSLTASLPGSNQLAANLQTASQLKHWADDLEVPEDIFRCASPPHCMECVCVCSSVLVWKHALVCTGG